MKINKVFSRQFTVFLLCFFLLLGSMPLAAVAGEPPQTVDSGSVFTGYQHDPMENPAAAKDIIVNENAIYGYSPNPDSESIGNYAQYDWSNPALVENARLEREYYHQEIMELYSLLQEMISLGETTEEIARIISNRRNEIRLESYIKRNDKEGLEQAKERNLRKYGNENGPTPEYLYERYGSWEIVTGKAFSTNPGMDACVGLYDICYDTYTLSSDISSLIARYVTLKNADVTLSASQFTYNTKVQKPTIKTIGGMALQVNRDYTLTWSDPSPRKPGLYRIIIRGTGNYGGTTQASYSITKAPNPLKVKGKVIKTSAKKLKKKALLLKRSKGLTVKKARGTVVYRKIKGNAKIRINRKNGRIRIGKNLKKGSYKIKVQVTAKGNDCYKKKKKTVIFKVVVKQ